MHGTPLQHAHACPKANHPSLTSSLLLPSLLNSPQLSKDVAAASFDIQTTGITGSLGHCTSADASKPLTCALKVAGLPVGTLAYHGIPFPIKAGALTGIPQLDITLPASLPSFASATTTTVKLVAANGDQVMCVEVMTKAAPAEVAAEEWFAAAAAPSAAPSGTYTGSKSVLGKSITATLKIDTATTFDLGITGAATLSCANEAYSYSAGSSSLQLPNIAKTGDCIHDALAKQSASIKSITYDAGADTISVTVKKSFLSLVLVLTKTADVKEVQLESQSEPSQHCEASKKTAPIAIDITNAYVGPVKIRACNKYDPVSGASCTGNMLKPNHYNDCPALLSAKARNKIYVDADTQ